ncbi:ABC transporter ATP-binding protein [Flavobacterium urocaniciphilum]|uniref:ABC-type polysaccharide/polyol phosphate transport system, ATPase component n=1 Tax=Flavobacterium urocaniciphilum TaxID=1299341 RepID=A0A1H8YRJ9_9FLAO|nr:ABC transporter ATP-binding protein [Flavobacterium urocaniciphilum]SEP54844.1 ABC-type polysaccharide/polyol phosphate transport system, ATPase component [Flavobacterium urocaniciphilum]
MSKVVIKAENISKQYRLGLVGTGTVKDDMKRLWYKLRGQEDPFLKVGEANDRSKKGDSDYVWSLKDINFEINQGDSVGIIGRNGAGKSTLLKILSQVTQPTTGKIYTKGRIASLLEVGTGFHPELTGRENIFLNGAILGMRKHEITRKLDEIIAFSGVERYIDTPVKRYSSGMYVRLAFAVAAHLESEILIVDEVLAVGDADFQKKCLGKMNDVSKGEGRTILFVSHNMSAVKNLCNKGIVLDKGSTLFSGDVNKSLEFYLSSLNNSFFENPKINVDIKESKGPKILKCEIKSGVNNNLSSFYDAGDFLQVSLSIKPDMNETREYSVVWFIYNLADEEVAVCSSWKMNNKSFNSLDTEIKFKIDTLGLLTGEYYLRFVLHVPGDVNFEDWNNAINFKIVQHDINKTGFEYTSIWNPKTFLKTEWL